MKKLAPMAAAFCVLACQVQVEPPPGAQISCASDADCPRAYACQPTLLRCVAVGALPPTQSVSFLLPRDGEENVSTTASLIIAFALPVDAADVAAHTSLQGPDGKTVECLVEASPEENTVLVRPLSELTALSEHTFTVRSGVSPHGTALALPSAESVQIRFTTAEQRDRTPPEAVSNVLIDRVSSERVDMSWQNASDADAAGVLVVRKHGGLLQLDPAQTPNDLPAQGIAYAVGARIGDAGAEVAGVVSGTGLSSVDLMEGPYDFAFFAMDRATNYSTPRRVPFIATGSVTWCPSESGSFSVSSPDTGTQSLLLRAPSGVVYTRFPPAGASLGSTVPIAASDVTLGTSYHARLSATNADGEYRDTPRPFVTSVASLAPLQQPGAVGVPKISLGGLARFGFDRQAWPAFEAEVDTNVAPASETWAALAAPTGDNVSTLMNAAGVFKLRVRPVVPGCAAGAWIESDEVTVGSGARFVSTVNGASGNNGLSPAAPYKTIKQATDDANGIDTMDVLITEGTYPEALLLKSNVRLMGGFSSDFSVQDPPPRQGLVAHQTVISGTVDSASIVTDSQSCFTAAFGPAGVTGSVLDRLTLQPPAGISQPLCALWLARGAGVSVVNSRLLTSPSSDVNQKAWVVQSRGGAAQTFDGDLLIGQGRNAPNDMGFYFLDAGVAADVTINYSLVRAMRAVVIDAGYDGSQPNNPNRFSITNSRFEGREESTAPISGPAKTFSCGGAGAQLTLRNNVFVAGRTTTGSAQDQTTGFEETGGCFGVVEGNIIDGGSRGQTSIGLDLQGGQASGKSLRIINNLISAGRGSQSRLAIRAQQLSGDVVIAHNAIFAAAEANGLLSTYGAILLQTTGGGYGGRYVNNVFLGTYDVSTLLYQPSNAEAFQNNLLIREPPPMSAPDVNLVLFNDNGTPLTSLSAFETRMCSEQVRTSGNSVTALPLSDLFVDATGGDGLAYTLEDNNWRLKPSAASVFAIGRNTMDATCGGGAGGATACTGAPSGYCGAVNMDRDGASRPADAPAAGPYEP